MPSDSPPVVSLVHEIQGSALAEAVLSLTRSLSGFSADLFCDGGCDTVLWTARASSVPSSTLSADWSPSSILSLARSLSPPRSAEQGHAACPVRAEYSACCPQRSWEMYGLHQELGLCRLECRTCRGLRRRKRQAYRDNRESARGPPGSCFD